ncbi:MAG TPA: undecaprenyl-diphosphate phosphatase, partial [Pseudogracilibacillus sp.]|nr:undecaprenyl-diphosphate phosphatase [Pseudogracilibacillus sp.]
MDLRELFVSFVLGLVEGLTEFIPVSSTGHMIIVDDLLLQSYLVLGSYELANTFKVVIQFGSILAVVIIFWKRLKTMILHSIHRDEKEEEHLKLSHIIIGLIPAMIAGLLLEPVIDAYLFRIETVIIGLLFGALLMFVADRNEQKPGRSLDSITYKDAFLIGLYQCLALWPGFSRSGATISGGVLFGYSHRAAADFTFIMAVPIMFGASVLSLYKK